MSLSSLNYPEVLPMEYTRYARIAATGKGFPDEVVKNDDIIKEYDLIASDRAVKYSIGIEERRWGPVGQPTSDLLLRAAKECFSRCDIKPEQIDRIIYTKLMGDCSLPGTSLKLLQKLGVRKGIPCMDIAAACSGFIHALDMALRFINSGDEYILVLGGDKTSCGLDLNFKPDTTTVFLTGDAVAGCIVERSDVQHFFSSYLYTDNSFYDYSYMRFGTQLLNSRDFEPDKQIFSMQMPSGPTVHEAILESGRKTVHKLLEAAGKSVEEIDIFVTCDQTHNVWRDQCKDLGIPEEKSLSLFKKFGNTVAAMTPMNLNALIESGKLKRGMTVLMTAHGAGASGGGFVFTY